MSALARLRDHGLRLHAIGEQLVVEPRSALTEELRALIRAQKRTILTELSAPDPAVLSQGEIEQEREARQAKVEAELRARPDLRVAFDLSDVPLKGGVGNPVSVVLAVRHGEHILSGELHIPRERWRMALFLSTVDADPGRPS